jgi:hypothetical protein
MPAKSEAQQRLMGMALASKRGKGRFGSKVQEIADSMTEKQLRDFAKTKHSDLPEKKAYIEGFMKRAAEYGYSENEIVEAVKIAEELYKTANTLDKIKKYIKKHEDPKSDSIFKGFIDKQKKGIPALMNMRRLDKLQAYGREMDRASKK